MRLLVLLLLVPLIAPAQEPATSLEVELVAPEAVDFGLPFELVVRRRHPRAMRLAPLDLAALKPIEILATSEESRDEGEGRLVVTRLRARVFCLDSVAVPALAVTAEQGGVERLCTSRPVTIAVRSALAADDPGRIEGPGGPLTVPPSRRRGDLLAFAFLAGLAVVLAVGVARARLRARAAPPGRPDPRPLFEARVAGSDALMPAEIARALRELLRDLHGLDEKALFAERLAASEAGELGLGPREGTALVALLTQLDREAYAGRSVAPARIEELRRAALELGRELAARRPPEAAP